MYVYFAAACRTQIERQGLWPQIERLSAEIEALNLEQALSRFERVYPYLKRKEGNLRLIARVLRLEQEPVLCWLGVFRRGDRDYEDFLREREDYADSALDHQIDALALRRWLAQRRAETRPQPQPRPLNPNLRLWLERPSLRIEVQGVTIYESEVWLERFADPAIQAHWLALNRAIASLADAPQPLGGAVVGDRLWLYPTEAVAILYGRWQTRDRPRRDLLFLLAPCQPAPTAAELVSICTTIFGQGSPGWAQDPSLDELTAIARRAYPSYLLADETNWLAIENAAQANLALSAEEESILHAVSTSQPSLPLFLNGQAGSGKSTLLFHLFADYCHRHLQACREQGCDPLALPHPLFLAYSDRLLKVARERALPLLASHYRFLARGGRPAELPDVSSFFCAFRRFLRHLLPLEERDRFSDANYISFHRFRQLLQRTWRGYSPERCWQVIRTFIKGYHLDERDTYLEPDDYAEIPRKERTVSPEDFARIHGSVWKWYHRYTRETGKWDDQDLIRRVLQLKCYQPAYTAIFCDEAQDFTRLELQLIVRLSVFSDCDLEGQHVESLPFAFAGDPLQTLNPTGFRWASLKAAVYNDAIAALSPTGRLNLDMNFAELTCNYRSAPAIVGLGNLIQLWRSTLFDLPELTPQRARQTHDSEPQKLILGHDIFAAELKTYLRDTIIIVPCDQGGELDYARNDPVLSLLLSPATLAQNQPPWNVLSAIAAKGLEFRQVVLYKFGEACHPQAWQGAEAAQAEEIKYFFNKLYVAASRATERLFLVDSEEGDRRLWQWATTPDAVEPFLQALKPERRSLWQSRLRLLNPEARAACISADDLAALASTFYSEGLDSADPELLRRAQGAYERLGDREAASRSEAWAQHFEENYAAAGRCFLAIQDWEAAWDSFWQGACWPELAIWYEQIGAATLSPEGYANPPEAALVSLRADREALQPLVALMAAPPTDFKPLWHFGQFLSRSLEEPTFAEQRFGTQWQRVVQVFQQGLATLLDQSPERATSGQWQAMGSVLQQLAAAKYAGAAALAGRCFYIAGEAEQAIACWEQAGATDQTDYHLAKAEQVGLPAGLRHWLAAEHYAAIVTAWKEAGRPRERDWLEPVAAALVARQKWEQALRVYAWLQDSDQLARCLTALVGEAQGESALLEFVQHECKGENWEAVLVALEASTTAPTPDLGFALARAIAHSRLTPSQLERGQRRRYGQWLKERVLFQAHWSEQLTVPEVGIAFERSGAPAEALSFYEQYVDGLPPLAIFARQRWLALRQQEVQRYHRQGSVKKALRARADVQKKSQAWHLELGAIALEIPEPPALEAQGSPPPLPPGLAGLPPTLTLQPLEADGWQFEERHLQVTILLATQQVLLRDRLNQRCFRFDAQAQTLAIDGAIIRASGNHLSLDCPESGFSGCLQVQAQQNQLTIAIAGWQDPLTLIWPQTPSSPHQEFDANHRSKSFGEKS